MVKQFTIPCDFQGQMAPVTLYIGHPEEAHHPINFQSQWLSSARGGQVPQDLMDTLQKLHDLAIENNADFEELCYYALISATNNSTGNGVSPDDINNYADDFLKKEASGIKPDMPTDANAPVDENNNSANQNNTSNTNVDANGNVITKTQSTENDTTGTAQSTTATDNNTNNNNEQYNTNNQVSSQQTTTQEPQKVMPTIDTTIPSNPSVEQTATDDVLLNNQVSNISENTKNIVQEAVQSTYSAEDEDLLLMDDMATTQPTTHNNNTTTIQSDDNMKEVEQINHSVYGDEDDDLFE